MNLLALGVLSFSSLAIHFVGTIDDRPRMAISCVMQASILGLGCMVMADLLGGNQQVLILLRERGVAFRAWPSLIIAHGGLWFAFCLPAVLVYASQAGVSIIDPVLFVLVLLTSSVTLASVSYALVHGSVRQKFLAAALWAAPVLVFLFFTAFASFGVLVLIQFDSRRAQAVAVAAYTGVLTVVLNPFVGWYLNRCPRKLHKN